MKQAKRILSIGFDRIPDESPDTSWLGEYSDTAKLFAIDRAHYDTCATQHTDESTAILSRVAAYLDKTIPDDDNRLDALEIVDRASDDCYECDCNRSWDRRAYRYFNPGSVEAFDPEASWIPANTTNKKEYWRAAMLKNAAQDYARMEALNNGYFEFIGIQANAELLIEGITQNVTSGGLWGIESDSDESYLKEIEQEQLSELRAVLAEVGFSKRAIATAIKEVKAT